MKIYRYFKRIFMSLLNIVNLENDIVLIILNEYTVIENIEICVYWNINHFIYTFDNVTIIENNMSEGDGG